MKKDQIKDILKKLLIKLKFNINELDLENMIEKLQKIEDENIVIDKIALALYLKFKDNEGYQDCLVELERISNGRDKREIESTALNNIKTNHKPEDISIEENHKLINDTLKLLCDRLNLLGVDYYLVGALTTFIKTNTPLFRYHGDIDFLVEEKDIEKVRIALEGTDYIFSDDRMNNKKTLSPSKNHTQGEHEVIANHKENEFHLGFFLFRREKDNSMTVREYFMKDENEKKVPMVLERHYPKELAKIEYPDERVNYNGTSFRTSSVESVCLKKQFTNHLKDKIDLEKIADKIDSEIVRKIRSYGNPKVSIFEVNKDKEKDDFEELE